MNKSKLILTTFASIIFSLSSFGQVVPEWSSSYSVNYPESILGSDMKTDKNGNVYISGSINDTSSNGYNIVVLKYNQTDALQWSQTLDSLNYSTK